MRKYFDFKNSLAEAFSLFSCLAMTQEFFNTCEIYECDNCYFRVTTLSEIKKHLEKKHKDEDDVKVIHGKINRKDEDEVDEVEYMQCEL